MSPKRSWKRSNDAAEMGGMAYRAGGKKRAEKILWQAQQSA